VAKAVCSSSTSIDGIGCLLAAEIYVMGDVMLHAPNSELKLGHTAEVNAHLVCINLKRRERGLPPRGYPERGRCGARFFDRNPVTLEDAIEFHAFEALAGV
jgi:hypothetical protein